MKFEDVSLFVLADFETTGVDPDTDYPVQLAVLITDRHLNVLDKINTYIYLWEVAPELFFIDSDSYKSGVTKVKTVPEHKIKWSDKGSRAAGIHGIPATSCIFKSHSKPPEEITGTINTALQESRETLPDSECNQKTILVSDNIQFEYAFMRELYKMTNKHDEARSEWPFHYTGWDTNLLLELTGVGDPENNPHDALYDVSILHTHVVRAFEVMGYYDQKEYPYQQ